MRWVYIAFDNIENDAGPSEMVEYYKEKYGGSVTVVQHGKSGASPLANVKDGDMVIVVGHGYFTAQHLAVSSTAENASKKIRDDEITANDMAKFLDEDGLPHPHCFVKCVSCCGGGLAGRKGDKLVEVTTIGCFASVLAKALSKRKYPNILVGGYPGLVGVMRREGGWMVQGMSKKKYLTVIDDAMMIAREQQGTLGAAGWKLGDLADHKHATTVETGWSGVEQIWFDGSGAQHKEAEIKAIKQLVRKWDTQQG